jgi:hypothetical protein
MLPTEGFGKTAAPRVLKMICGFRYVSRGEAFGSTAEFVEDKLSEKTVRLFVLNVFVGGLASMRAEWIRFPRTAGYNRRPSLMCPPKGENTVALQLAKEWLESVKDPERCEQFPMCGRERFWRLERGESLAWTRVRARRDFTRAHAHA